MGIPRKQATAPYPAHHHVTLKGYVRFLVPKQSSSYCETSTEKEIARYENGK